MKIVKIRVKVSLVVIFSADEVGAVPEKFHPSFSEKTNFTGVSKAIEKSPSGNFGEQGRFFSLCYLTVCELPFKKERKVKK